jgi:ribonuclease HII
MLASRFTQDDIVEIGVDEAGRGSFWGPLVAGAVIVPPESEWTDLQRDILLQMRDSKKISPKKRANLAKVLREQLPLCGVGVVGAEEINEKGITWANQEAFRRAIGALPVIACDCRVLLDGVLSIDKWIGQQETIIEGDNKYIAIAAASILAKVTHDQWIKDYCVAHPECNERYDLLQSNGYGTAKHREGIKTYGGHELHRSLYIQHWLPGSTRVPKTKSTKKGEPCLIRFSQV